MRTSDDGKRTPPESVGDARGWYLWDSDRGEVVRGPFIHAESAVAVRTEIESRTDEGRKSCNLWVVDRGLIAAWRAELASARTKSATRSSAAPKGML